MCGPALVALAWLPAVDPLGFSLATVHRHVQCQAQEHASPPRGGGILSQLLHRTKADIGHNTMESRSTYRQGPQNDTREFVFRFLVFPAKFGTYEDVGDRENLEWKPDLKYNFRFWTC